jgi:hypothetical protein
MGGSFARGVLAKLGSLYRINRFGGNDNKIWNNSVKTTTFALLDKCH